MPTVRLAQQADMPRIGEMFDAYRQFYEQPSDLAMAIEFIRQRFVRGESTLLVAESAESAESAAHGLVGFCQLYPLFCSVEAKPIYILYDLFVDPAARGNGAGRALLQAAEAAARAQGKARMDLSTARTNKTAQALYESLGWVRDDVFLTYSRHIAPECA